MILKKVDPLSTAKLLGILYGFMGFVFGIFVTLAGLLGAGPGGEGPESIIFGVGSVILLPLLYGFMGAVGGAFSAAIYNVAASFVGGIELEFASREQEYVE